MKLWGCILGLIAAGTASAATLPVPAARLNATLGSVGGHLPGNILALQICLDRRGFSCNTLDGACGRKTQVALATWCAANSRPYLPGLEDKAWELYFQSETNLFRTIVVDACDLAAITHIPLNPADKAKLSTMGFESLLEKYSELGHCSEAMTRLLNPSLTWPNPPAGSRVILPDCAPRNPANPRHPDGIADVLRVSISRLEITAFDDRGNIIGLFPCSIAANKSKLPPPGEIQVKNTIRNPNYTYTAERADATRRIARHILPPGPNNPVGTSWIGLTLPTYGIHGTPYPERIGRAESHGCFRLANWNADRLRRMCDPGTGIVIEP